MSLTIDFLEVKGTLIFAAGTALSPLAGGDSLTIVYQKRRKTPEFIHGDIRRARKRIVWYSLDVSRGTAIPTDSPTNKVSEHDYYT